MNKTLAHWRNKTNFFIPNERVTIEKIFSILMQHSIWQVLQKLIIKPLKSKMGAKRIEQDRRPHYRDRQKNL
jgi:hypothetical protein